MPKTDDEILKEALAGGPPKTHVAKLPALQKRCTKDELLSAIERFCGCSTYICSFMDCSYGQLLKAVEKWGLQQQLQDARQRLVDQAETILVKAMQGEDMKLAVDAAKFVLSKNRKAQREWLAGNGDVNLEVKSDAPVQINQIFGI